MRYPSAWRKLRRRPRPGSHDAIGDADSCGVQAVIDPDVVLLIGAVLLSLAPGEPRA
jgi:hypothetical protein